MLDPASPSLRKLARETDQFSVNLRDTAKATEGVKDATGTIKTLMEIPGKIVKATNTIHKLFDSVEKMAKAFSRVGATKPVAKVINEVVETVDEQIQKIEKTAKKLEKKFKKPIEKMEKAEMKMEDIEKVLKVEAEIVALTADRLAVISTRLDNTKIFVDAVDADAIDVPDDFKPKLIEIRERLAGVAPDQFGGVFGLAEAASEDAVIGLDATNRGFQVIRDTIDKLSIDIPSFNFDILLDFSVDLSGIADIFDTLLGPLRSVYDAVGDVLDALGSIFGWILKPFEYALDAILDATGILSIFDGLKDELLDLLPDFSDLFNFDLDFLDKFKNLFENPFANIEFGFDWLLEYFALPNIDFPNIIPDINLPNFNIPDFEIPQITLPFDIPGIDLDIPAPQLPWFMSTVLGPATAGDDIHLGLLHFDEFGGETVGPTRGDDLIVGGDSDDSLAGGEGSDILIGGGGDDTLVGGDGDDYVIYSGTKDDYAIIALVAEDGTPTGEWIIGDYRKDETLNDGIDRLFGIEGVVFTDDYIPIGEIDTYVQTKTDDGEQVVITVNPQFSNLVDELTGEKLFLSNGEKGDWFFGNVGSEIAFSGDGPDRLTSVLNGMQTIINFGRPGDELNGENGDDVFLIGDGSGKWDVIRGGADIDTVDYDAETTRGLNVYMPSGALGDLFRPPSIVMDADFEGRMQDDPSRPLVGIIQGIEHLFGTRFDDNFWGTDADNTLDGGGGWDQLRGLGGDDVLFGGDGSDILVGDRGNDIVYGGAGDDQFVGGLGNDLYFGGSGFNEVFYSIAQSSQEVDFVDFFDTGYANNNYDMANGIHVHAFTDRPGFQIVSKYGSGLERGVRLGEDQIHEMLRIIGTDNDDVITVATDRNQGIFAGYGDDRLFGGSGVSSSNLRGGGGDDTFFSHSDNADRMFGGEGSDTWRIFGSRGVDGDQIFGDDGGTTALEGIDTIDFTGSHYSWHILMRAGTGLGTLTSKFPISSAEAEDPRFIQPTDGVNGIDADGPVGSRPEMPFDLRSPDANTSEPGGRAVGFGEFEVIIGSDQRDMITVGSPDGAVTVHGQGGDDVLFGSQVAGDQLYGGEGDDVLGTLNQSFGSDPDSTHFDAGIVTRLDGGAGDDLFVAGDARERFIGGDGIDELTFEASRRVDNRQQGVEVNLTTGLMAGGYAEGDAMSGIENVTGSQGDDEITGDGGVNLLIGWDGDDVLRGMGGDDALFGNAGQDSLYGGDGFDSLHGGLDGDLLDGGDGIDIASWTFYQQHPKGGLNLVTGETSGVTADLATGIAGADRLVDIENLYGSALDDDLSGDDGQNALAGAGGDDVLRGRGEADVLTGGFGDDALFGGDGDDWLNGGAGTNTLDGGADRDTIDYGLADYGITLVMAGAGDRAGFDTGTVASHIRLDWTVWSDSLTEIQDPLGALGDTIASGTDETRFTQRQVGGLGTDEEEDDTFLDADPITPERIFRFLNPEFAATAADLADIAYLPDDFDLTDEQDITIIDRWEAALDHFKNVEVMVGGLGDDDFTGNDDDNEFHGSAGADVIRGGLGDDTSSYLRSEVGVNIDLAAGVAAGGDAEGDLLISIEDLRGSAHDDVLRGDLADNRIAGEGGSDSIFGGAGEDTAVFDVDAADVIVTRAMGGVRIIVADGATVITDDFVSDDVEVFEFAGGLLTRDEVAGLILTGNDDDVPETLLGTPIADNIDGKRGDDRIEGRAGDDELNGGLDDDVLLGEAGADTLRGGPGEDALFGGEGDDLLDGGADVDAFAGGAGDDTYVVDDASEVTTEAPGEGNDGVLASVSVALQANVEMLTLTGEGDLDGTGNGLGNVIDGNAGDNTLTGLGGADTLDGRGGADVLIGGEGDDVYRLFDGAETLVEALGEGVDEVVAQLSFTLADHFEALTLTGLDDLDGTGNALDNRIAGNAGDNVLSGFAGDDSFIGSAGDDLILGGAGDDTVVYDFDRADAKYDFNTPGFVLVQRLDGTDRIEDVEFYRFADVFLTAAELSQSLVPKQNINLTGSSSSDAYFTSPYGLDNSREGGGEQFLHTAARSGDNDGNRFYFTTTFKDGGGRGKFQGSNFLRLAEATATSMQIDFDGGNGSHLSVGLFRKPLTEMIDADWAYWETNLFNGDDRMQGTYHDDLLVGYAGDDELFGGKGDKVDYDVSGRSPDRPTSTIRQAGRVEEDAAFYVHDGDDELRGELGDDLIDGGTGHDRLFGGRGDDQLWGGGVSNRTPFDDEDPEAVRDVGADSLYGGDGDDTLDGMGGDDLLEGGDGADVFVLRMGMGADVVVDWDASEDRIDDGLLSQEERDAITDETLASGDRVLTLSDGSSLTLLAPGNSRPEGAVAIVGEARQGETLGADASAVRDDDGLGEIGFQWRRDGIDIAGADAQTYTLVQADVGAEVDVVATYVDGGGTIETIASATTSAVLNVNDAPSGGVETEGAAQAGAVLSARAETLDDADGVGLLRFEWLRDGKRIAGAQEETYALSDADIGAEISVAVEFTDAFGVSERVVSAATAEVAPEPVIAAPVAADDAFAATAGTPLSGNVLEDNGAGADGDVEPTDVLSVTGLEGAPLPAGATTLASGATVLLRADGTFDYRPGSGFRSLANGAAALDGFSYTLSDQGGLTDTATVEITVTGVNDAPIARNDVIAGTEDAPVSGNLFANNGSGIDVDLDDGDVFRIVSVAGEAASVGQRILLPSGATMLISADGAFEYDPNGAFEALDAGETGMDAVVYRVGDDGGLTADATVLLSIAGADDGPTPTNKADKLVGDRGRDTIDGGRGNDDIKGGGGGDLLKGGAGKDKLGGGGGKDKLFGDGGRDRLDGGGANDQLFGGGGKDLLIGGKGKDKMAGGGGNDVFQFTKGDGKDVIRDFRIGKDAIEVLKGAKSFKQLDISRDGKDALVEFANVEITLQKVKANRLDEDDFMF